MKVLAAGVVVVALWLIGAGAAWGDPIPLCNGAQCLPMGSWYTTPVSFRWQFSGTSSGNGCGSQNYTVDTNRSSLAADVGDLQALPDSTFCTVLPTTVYYFIQVEISSPTATVTLARPPDANGWYNHPVAGATTGTSFSGIASCTSTTYAGPNTAAATVSGTCTDNAGKTVTVTSAPFHYDATAPSLSVTATPGDEGVALSWQTGGDIAPIASMTVARTSSSD